MMDQTKFRLTNQSLSSVYLSVSYDLCLPVPLLYEIVQSQPSTLPGSVGNIVTHALAASYIASLKAFPYILPINNTFTNIH